MRRFVAKCDCGAVSEVPVPKDGKKLVGRCCQCSRKVNTDNGWWLNLESKMKPKPELDLLAVI